MAELTAKVEAAEAELDGKFAVVTGQVASIKSDVESLTDSVAAPVAGWVTKVTEVKTKLDARFETMKAELQAFI